VARDRHPAVVTSPKAVGRSRDRGCNGHRIPRRVLVDGRHPGSSRSVALHGAATTVVSAASRILRPVRPTPLPNGSERANGDEAAPAKASEAEDERRVATGVSEARSQHRRGKKTPTLVSEGRKAVDSSYANVERSAEATQDVVKRPGPRKYHAEPKTPRGLPAAKVARASRERARCGCTQIVWVADVG
jgi:hypothetical protein